MKLHWIEEGRLAAGGVPVNRADMESLRAQGVGAVVSLIEYPLTTYKGINADLLAELDLDILHVPVDDHTAPTVTQVSQVAQYIKRMEAEGKAVYLHCAAGIGRTGTMLHAYYVVEGLGLDAAKSKVKKAKSSSQFLMLSAEQQDFLHKLADEFRQDALQFTETIYFRVLPGKERDFESTFAAVTQKLAAEAHHYTLHSATDVPGQYLLIVGWQGGHDGFLSLNLPVDMHSHLLDEPLVESYHTVELKGRE